MYLNLKAEMARKGVTVKELAELTGIRYNTLAAKLSGRSRLALDEAVQIKKALVLDAPLEYLFGK